MGDCEQIPKIAQDKWATLSESLRLLRTNEQGWDSLIGFLSKSLVFSKKMSNLLKKTSDSLIFGERPEQIPYGRSFLVSSLRDLLTLIIFGERPDDLQWAMGEWVMNKWANSQPCKWVTVS